jgi:NAD(P)-dependent dehydrogenase (short-subunit alcohol dehydrogenase family)
MGFDVKGCVALVTGANRGIGKAIVESLLEAGTAKVYAAVRNTDSARPLIEKFGDKVVAIEIDLARPATMAEAARRASDVQLVINNAGVLKTTSALAPDALESLQFEIDVNVYGFLRLAQTFAPVLKHNGGGAFVQLNSVVSVKAFPEFATYCASKAAAYSLTQSLREQLGNQGTHVLSVHPGPIATDMADDAGLTEMAEPPAVVAQALVTALRAGDFHAWPDAMARQVGEAYASFATNIVEANLAEG